MNRAERRALRGPGQDVAKQLDTILEQTRILGEQITKALNGVAQNAEGIGALTTAVADLERRVEALSERGRKT